MIRRAWPALILLFALACEGEPSRTASAVPEPGDWRERLAWAEVDRPEAAAVITLPAEVVLPPCAVRELGPPLPGRVARWHVRSGAEVQRGTPLADVVSTELADLDATEKELRRVVRDRRRVLRAQREHVEAGMQAVQTVYEAELALSEAEARLAAVRRQLDARRELGADPKQGDMEWQWISPVDGVVRELACAVGSMPAPGDHCVTILDTSKAEVRVAVPERFLPRVEGEPRLRWLPAWERDPAAATDMVLTRRDPLVEPNSRTQAHYFRPAPSAQPVPAGLLTVGSTGRATLLTPAAADMLRVPPLAVVRLAGRPVVFVQRGEDADPQPVPVTLVGRFEGNPLVRSGDLSVGDRVVARGGFLLKSMRLLASE